MTAPDTATLDTEEYLHLALHASRHGDHHAALQYLHAALSQDAGNALATYLLAAEHAEIGLYARAREGFRRALTLQPGLETARFQLGLLHLQLDELAEAAASFTHLAEFAGDDSLRTFAQGMRSLLAGEEASARRTLADGIARCTNPPLRADMQRILARLEERQADASSTQGETVGAAPAIAAAPTGSQAASERKPVFLGAYRSSRQPGES